MAFQCHTFLVDDANALHLSASAVTSAGTGLAADGSTALSIDLGGASPYAKFAVVLDISAIDKTTGDELVEFQVQGSTTSNFSTAYICCNKRCGGTTATGDAVATPNGTRLVLFGDNVVDTSATDPGSKVACRYLRLRYAMGGTSPSVTFKAWLVPMT